jgi:hypothetical protein
MKHWLRVSAAAGSAIAWSVPMAFAAEPVCSAEYERVGAGGYEWHGTILTDDGKLHDFAISGIEQAATIAAIATGERGATGAYEALLAIATERASVARPEAIAGLQAMIVAAYDADITIVDGAAGAGTWSILCFAPLDPAVPLADPVLIERRGDRRGVNPAADGLRAALVALDPAFGIEAAAATP